MTSTLLVRSKEGAETESRLDSSRYTVKPTVPNSTSNKLPKKESPKENPAPTNIEPTNKQKPEATIETATPAATPVIKPESQPQKILEKEDEEYTSQVHPYDHRKNLVSISIAPSILYADAKSEYWFRNFDSSGPGVSLNADIWLSPEFGLNLDYMTTLAAELNVDPSANRHVVADHRFTSAGLQIRRFSSLSRKANNLNLLLQYTEYKLIVPKAESNRSSLTSSGISLGIGLRAPTSVVTAWTVGAELLPKLKVKEESGATPISTGSNPVSYAAKFYFGQEYSIDRRNQIFWRFSHRFDKTIYEGTTDPVDPITGGARSGVEVKTGISLFELGYTWGD